MNICLLGASGSIGRQTIDVIDKNPNDFNLVSFSVGKRTRCISHILKKHPNVTHICISDKKTAKRYQNKYPNIVFFYEDDGLNKLIKESNNDMVVNALVGFVGLVPSITSLENNKLLALANKESLVVGGELINKLLKEGKGKLYPIDSEHSALWKCLKVEDNGVKKLHLTASGGAFRKLSLEELNNVTPMDALNHPTWKMGNKITIDCATMMNKAFELIEAYYLFGYKTDQLSITLHDESYLHSYVEYDDYFRGEINKPDMRNPIKFALYQGDIPFDTKVFASLEDLKGLTFHKFDINRYPAVKYASLVIEKGGNLGAIINASNEVAVNAFLRQEIPFLMIEEIIAKSVKNIKFIKNPSLEDLIKVDRETREFASRLVKEGHK